MGKINSHELNDKVRAVNYRRLFQTFQDNNYSETEHIMRKLFTPSELEMLGKRIGIDLLEVGAGYRDIDDILKVSKSTVARVNNSFRYDKEFREIIKEFVKEEYKPRKKYGYTLTQAAKDLGLILRIAAQIH